MKPAPWPRDDRSSTRVVRIAPSGGDVEIGTVRSLAQWLHQRDLLVFNNAATVPASLAGRTEGGVSFEARLASEARDGSFWMVLFDGGSWRTPTEHRGAPPVLRDGDRVHFGEHLTAVVAEHAGDRRVRVRFTGTRAEVWPALFRHGRPVQYAYVRDTLAPWHVQTVYGSRPWAFEAPSAGHAFMWETVLDLRRVGVQLAWLTHAAGLSSTGDAALDAAMPWAERYDIPAETVARIAETRAHGGRVVAVGTSVVRALEGSAATHGELVPGVGETDLRLGPDTVLRVVDGLFTGMHEPTASHFALLQAFAPGPVVEAGYARAEREGFACHEFGDASLIVGP